MSVAILMKKKRLVEVDPLADLELADPDGAQQPVLRDLGGIEDHSHRAAEQEEGAHAEKDEEHFLHPHVRQRNGDDAADAAQSEQRKDANPEDLSIGKRQHALLL